MNWGSDAQIRESLLHHKVPLKDTTPTGAYKVGKDVLQAVYDNRSKLKRKPDYLPMLLSIIYLRRIKSRISTFFDGYKELLQYDGKIHPRLLLHGARTGRLSSVSPNIQNVPRKGLIKTFYKSRWEGGFFGLIDLSQAELRMMAIMSNDQAFIANLMFDDAHTANAAMCLDKKPEDVTKTERKASKAITFGLAYGGSPKNLAKRAGLDVKLVQKVADAMERSFPMLMGWMEFKKQQAMDDLEATTVFGRTRRYNETKAIGGLGAVKRQAVNTPAQSTANDINLIVLRGLARRLKAVGAKSFPMFLVHDSTAIDIHPDELEMVARFVQEAFTDVWDTPIARLRAFKVLPIEGDLEISTTWAGCESTNEFYNPLYIYPCNSHVGRLDDYPDYSPPKVLQARELPDPETLPLG